MQFRLRCPLHAPRARSPPELSTYHSALLHWAIRALVPMPRQQEAIHHSVHQAMTVTKALHLTPSQRLSGCVHFDMSDSIGNLQDLSDTSQPIKITSLPTSHCLKDLPARHRPVKQPLAGKDVWCTSIHNAARCPDTKRHGPGRKQTNLIKDTSCGCNSSTSNHINGRQTSWRPLKLGGNFGLQSIKRGLFLQPPLFQIVNIQIPL